MGIGPVATKVTFKLSDVTSRYLNSWIYLVFYIEDNVRIKPLILSEVTIRAKRWVPKNRRGRDELPQEGVPSFEFLP